MTSIRRIAAAIKGGPATRRFSGSIWAKALAAGFLCIAVAACQPVERFATLGKAVLAQLFGADYQDSVQFSHESQAIMKSLAAPERAFSAQFVDSAWHFRPRDERRFFVMGSIIAKPKGTPAADPAGAGNAGVGKAGSGAAGLGKARLALRAGPSGDPGVVAMRQRLQDRLNRMGVRGAKVDVNAQGEMRVELPPPPGGFRIAPLPGSDLRKAPTIAPQPGKPAREQASPTRFEREESPEAGAVTGPAAEGRGKAGRRLRPVPVGLVTAGMDRVLANVAATGVKKCPEGVVTAEQLADPAVATECVWKAMQESGDFEYCDKNFIFRVELESWARLRKPAGPAPRAGAIPGATRGSGTPAAGAAAPAPGMPNDPLFGLQWNIQGNTQAAGGKNAGAAGFADFWTKRNVRGDRRIVVAVIDTGLDTAHPEIKASANIARQPDGRFMGFDFVSDPEMGNDNDGRDDDPRDPGDKCAAGDPSAEDSFHGTHVAGIIGAGASNNGLGIAGGAWNVTIVPVRAVGKCGGQLRDINDAIRFSAGIAPGVDGAGREVWINPEHRPADIINLSLGLFESCPASMQAAIDAAHAAGAIVVVAAGNDRVDTRYYAPAGCKNVVVVAASDAGGKIAPYSNFGTSVSLMAPGGNLAEDSNGDGQPDGILSTRMSHQACTDPLAAGKAGGTDVGLCYFAYLEGTSMAAPHVSAALALLKAAAPGRKPDDYVSMLTTKAVRPLTANQSCTGKCVHYAFATPLPGEEDKPAETRLCARPCGAGRLDLSQAIDVR